MNDVTEYMPPAAFVELARELGASEAEINEKLGHRPMSAAERAAVNAEINRTINEDVLGQPVLPVMPEPLADVSLLSLMPGRNRAERRFALHCARRALRGTLSAFKRTKLEQLSREQSRAR